MTVPSAPGRTNEADKPTQPLDAFLADAGLAFDDIPVAMAIHRRALSEERRLTVERITAVLEPTEPTLDEIAGYGLDGGPGTNFNYLQWRLDRIRAILDEVVR